MTRSRPKWQRKGYASEAEYRARLSARAKTRNTALMATTVKATHRLIFEAMWNMGDFDSTQVVVTKQQLMAKANCSLDTVRRALRALREEGSIKPLKNWQGGAGVPTTWQLLVPGQNKTPLDRFAAKLEDEKNREAAWKFLKQKYGPLEALRIMDERGEEPPASD